jgi:hypothetical protein
MLTVVSTQEIEESSVENALLFVNSGCDDDGNSVCVTSADLKGTQLTDICGLLFPVRNIAQTENR